MDEDTLLEGVLDERMDEWMLLERVLDERMDEGLLLVDGTLMEDDADWPHDAVTVTVTVSFGQLLQSLARGTAAVSPNREARTIFEYILPRKKPLVQKECVNDSECVDPDYRNQKS